jgi:hypothetical protein
LEGSAAGEFGTSSGEEDLAQDMAEHPAAAALAEALRQDGAGGPEQDVGSEFGDQFLEDALAELESPREAGVAEEQQDGEGGGEARAGAAWPLLGAINIEQNGYVRCAAAPWAERAGGVIGRFTYYPVVLPPHQQNIALRCFMHPRCSAVRRRARYTEEALLRWLLDSTPPVAAAGSVAAEEEAQRHRLRAATLLP